MKIQSLSIVVPNRSCINHCKFCVSHMHCNDYKNQMDENLPFFDLYLNDYLKRLEFARDNGCNTVMLTGTSEPQQNRKFLTYFGMFMRMMNHPFRWVEMQTTGVMLDENYLRFLRNHVGVNLISVSLASFYDMSNANVIGCPQAYTPNLRELCNLIKKYDFSLRLSINLTSEFDKYRTDPTELFKIAKDFGADQVTLRALYRSGTGSPEDLWVKENSAKEYTVGSLIGYVRSNGTVLGRLPHGAVKYSINGMSVVVDNDCMAKKENSEENYKYLILQPNCKLYSQWDDPASLIF